MDAFTVAAPWHDYGDIMTRHAAVLLALLPTGGYEKAHGSLIEKDILAHAQALEDAQSAADVLLEVAAGIPPELIDDYEKDYGLPRACLIDLPTGQAARIAAIDRARTAHKNYDPTGIMALFASFGMTVANIGRHYPMQCTTPCTAAVNSVRNRFRLTISVQTPITADISCIIDQYLPTAWRVDIIEV